MACRVCHRPLNRVVTVLQVGQVVRWDHGAPSPHHPPHEPEPIPADNTTEYVCDFCSDRPATWDLGANNFVTLIGKWTVNSNANEEYWASCERCYDLIERGEMKRLSTIALNHLLSIGAGKDWPREQKRKLRPGLLQQISLMHRRFVSSRTFNDRRSQVIPVRADPDGRNRNEALRKDTE